MLYALPGILLLLFLPSFAYAAPLYSGSYPNGLTVTENDAVVDGADVTNPRGVCLKITGDRVTVKNSKIYNCPDHGVLFLGTNGGIIENSEITRAAMQTPPNTTSGGWPSLLKVQSVDESTTGLAHDITIRNNYIHEGYGECMGLRGSRITVTGNRVKDCYSIGIYSNSDHTTVDRNTVECTGNPEFNRDGLPMAGIAFAEETFPSWGAHGHDSQTVTNNTVTGCKYGVRYGTSSNNQGLSDTIIAFNKFFGIRNSPISITHYVNERNVQIHDNTIDARPLAETVTPRVSDTPRATPTLQSLPADITGDGRVNIYDYNALVENFGRSGSAGWIRADIVKNGKVDIYDFNSLIEQFGRSI